MVANDQRMPAASSYGLPPGVPPGEPPAWLRNRATLEEAARRFDQSLATAGLTGVDWRAQVAERLAGLRGQLTEHVIATEGPGGLYAELLAHAPRLDRPIARLVAEHQAVLAAVDALAAALPEPPATVRQLGYALLTELAEHRQRGADLVYEAFATDIGGET